MKNEIDENRKKVYIVLSLYISLLTAQMCHFFVHDFCKKEKNKQVEYQKKSIVFWNFEIFGHDMQCFHRNLTDFTFINTKFQNPADITMPANIYLFFRLRSFSFFFVSK